MLEPRPIGSGGWIRRLSPFLLAHRRNVTIAFGAAIAGQAVAAVTPVFEKVIIDDGIVHQTAPGRAVARPARAGRRLLVLRLVPPPLGRRAGQPRRAVRPAQRHLRTSAAPRLRRPRPAADRPAGLAGVVRPRPDPGSAVVPADHARQRGHAAAVARDHGDPVTPADTCDAGDPAGAARHLDEDAQADLPGDLARPAARRRGGRRGRRVGHRRAGGQGLRSGGPGAGPPGRCRQRAVRVTEPPRAAAGPLHRGPAGGPLAGPGRRARPRRLAGDRGPPHPRHLPRLLVLPRAARRPGADVRRAVRRRPAGPGRRRAGTRRARRQRPRAGEARRRRARARPR